jgi:osmotically inducible protein OsmC
MPPRQIDTEATVSQHQRGPGIGEIKLTVRADVPGLDAATFEHMAARARDLCPVSLALSGTKILLDARLESPAAPHLN